VNGVHEFVKTSLRVHRNEKGWRALVYIALDFMYSFISESWMTGALTWPLLLRHCLKCQPNLPLESNHCYHCCPCGIYSVWAG